MPEYRAIAHPASLLVLPVLRLAVGDLGHRDRDPARDSLFATLAPVPAEFRRSLRSLNRDGFGRSIAGILVAAALLAAWMTWFLTVPVTRYAVTDQAHVEADQAIHAIQAPVEGRVVLSHLLLGREVEAGDTLVEIETDGQRLQVQEEESRVAAIGTQLDAVRAQLAAQAQASQTEAQAFAAALDQSRAQSREADALREFAEREASRLSRLQTQGLVSESDEQRAAAEARSRRAATEALTLSTTRMERDQRRTESERQAAIARLQGERDQLEGARVTARRTIERLRFEVARRRIVAPVAGRLGEVAVVRVGAWVDEGAALGAVVPRGDLRIVAEFLPPAALGRIQPGQPAWMHLDGFPWTQYGAVRATVERVADEVRDGRVRVELRVDPDPDARVSLQHGLPGSLEVQTERVTAAALALRTAGRLLDRPENQRP